MLPAQSACLRRFLPPPPPTNAADPNSAAAFVPPALSSEDRISQLPEDIQRSIVSLLPLKNGAATAVLSPSWRWIWSSTPLVLDDRQLRPPGMEELEFALELDDGEYYYFNFEAAEELARVEVERSVDAILRRHPGPFRLVRLTSSPSGSYRKWFRILAAKGVEELVVVNSEWPRALMMLSVELLRCRSLKSLHIALCQLPRLTEDSRPGYRRVVHFPKLLQLVLCHAFLAASAIDDYLAGSPVLEMLAFIEGSGVPQYIDVARCPKLKYLLIWNFKPLRLNLEGRRLERVILGGRAVVFAPPRTRVVIRRVPNLRMIGYLDPRIHVLESGDTVIQEWARPSPDIMVPSVEILAVKIQFGVREEERTLISYLKLFPNITTLHIQSKAPPHPENNEYGRDFWSNYMLSSITCISKIKKIMFYDFHGMENNSELSFIASIAQTCNLLEHMLITISENNMEPNWTKAAVIYTMTEEVQWANEETTLNVITGNHKEWEYRAAADPSLTDPFDYI